LFCCDTVESRPGKTARFIKSDGMGIAMTRHQPSRDEWPAMAWQERNQRAAAVAPISCRYLATGYAVAAALAVRIRRRVSRSASTSCETVLCVSVSTLQPAEPVPVVAFTQICVFLIVPGIRSHRRSRAPGGTLLSSQQLLSHAARGDRMRPHSSRREAS
jgi:hypothetical protein